MSRRERGFSAERVGVRPPAGAVVFDRLKEQMKVEAASRAALLFILGEAKKAREEERLKMTKNA